MDHHAMCLVCGNFVDSNAQCVNLVDEPHDSGYRVCDDCKDGEIDGAGCWRCGGEGVVLVRLRGGEAEKETG